MFSQCSAHAWLALCGAIALHPGSVAAQAVAPFSGDEYNLAGNYPGIQDYPSVALNASGGWVVWQDFSLDRSGSGIGMARLNGEWINEGARQLVNTSKLGQQQRPEVTLLPDGGAAVAWQGGKIGFQQVFLRFVGPDGRFTTRELALSPVSYSRTERFRTNLPAYRNNRELNQNFNITRKVSARVDSTGNPRVATLTDGSVIVAYSSNRRLTTNEQELVLQVKTVGTKDVYNSVLTPVVREQDRMQDVYLRRFSATGRALGSEVMLNRSFQFNQRNPSIAALTDGRYVAAWISEQPTVLVPQSNTDPASAAAESRDRVDVIARVFNADGSPLTAEIRVNTDARMCAFPAVCGTVDGGFTVAWSQRNSVRTNGLDILAASFDASGSPLLKPVRLNQHQFGDQFNVSLTALPSGSLAVWSSLGQDGSWEGVFATRIGQDGPLAAEWQVNTSTALRQSHPAVAADATGRGLAVWANQLAPSEGSFDIFARRLNLP